jgi:hypothetical protein
LDNITVDPNLAFAHGFKVYHGTQGPADQPLDFLRAARLFAFCGFPRHPAVG